MQTRGDDFGSGGVGLGQEKDELFAADAGHHVVGAARVGFQRIGDGGEAAVAETVPVLVIDALEEVDIDDEQGEGLLFTGGAAPGIFESGVEVAAIGNAGQRVFQR